MKPWTRETYDRRVKAGEVEVERAEAKLSKFDEQKAALEAKLEAYSDEEKAYLAQRVENAKADLEWIKNAPVEASNDETDDEPDDDEPDDDEPTDQVPDVDESVHQAWVVPAVA